MNQAPAPYWTQFVGGPDAVGFDTIEIGAAFRFAADPPDVRLIKLNAAGWYTRNGRRFKTGRYTAVIPQK